MEMLNLTSTETRYFSDLFLCCDEDKAGKVALLKATELFRSSKVPNDVLKQIFSIAHPTLANHLNRVQFYGCLKLIAAHQAHIPLNQELLTKQIDLPLPRFKWRLSGSPDLIELSEQESLQAESLSIYNATCNQELNASASQATSLFIEEKGDASTDSEMEQNDPSECVTRNSPSVWSTTSDSPTPTNSVAERTWGSVMGNQMHWCEEQRQLLGTEEESSDKHSSDEPDGDDIDTSSVWPITQEQREYYAAQFKSLQPNPEGLLAGSIARMFFEKSRLPVQELRHIWQLSDVTRDGALNLAEFNTAMHLVVLRRNHIPLPITLPACLIPNTDNTRNMESDAKHSKPLNNDHQNDSNTEKKDFITQNNGATIYKSISVDHTAPQVAKSERNSIPNDFGSTSKGNDLLSGGASPVQGSTTVLSPNKKDTSYKEWTKFVDSPTSSISSPGPKPVNFDFHLSSVETDPKILHPVPLRVTPDGNNVTNEDDERMARAKSDLYEHKGEGDLIINRNSPKKMVLNNNFGTNMDALTNDIKPIQRPQAKKGALKTVGAIPPPPQNRDNCTLGTGTTQNRELVATASLDSDGPISLPNFSGAIKKEKPPPPPPRQYRTHARSSSLDLNKLKHSPPALSPPQIPPRVSPGLGNNIHKNISHTEENNQDNGVESSTYEQDNLGFADFTQFPESRDNVDCILQLDATGNIRRHGAFEVYRKPTPRSSQSPERPEESEKDVFVPNANYFNNALKEYANAEDKKELLKKLQNQNILLLKLCQDLSVELSIVQAERTELQAKLDAAKPFSAS